MNFNYSTQTLRDLSLEVYKDENYKIGQIIHVRQNILLRQKFVVLDFVNNPKDAPGLEAIAFIHRNNKNRIFIVVKGSENRPIANELFNDWIRADFGELQGLSKPLQSTGLETFVDRVFQRYSESKFVLVGHSLGGALIQKTFANNPERYESAVGFSSANGYMLLSRTQQILNDNGKYDLFINYYNQHDPIHYTPFAKNYVGRQAIVNDVLFPDARFDYRGDIYNNVTKLHNQEFMKFNWYGELNHTLTKEKTLNLRDFSKRFLS